MSITKIAYKLWFEKRQHELNRHITDAEQMQHEVLQYLIQRGKATEYGRNHLFDTFKGYDDFARHIPVNSYEELKGDIDRMRHGERDILWPGLTRCFAKSSGTTNDKSKFIPVTKEGLQNIHYKGGKDVVATYLANNPNSRIFDGKSMILGGSHSANYGNADSLVGDLSAILIENINPLANIARTPGKKVALLSDFEVKRERIARITMKQNVTTLSGVPSWMLSVLVKVLELTGKSTLDEVWPNLEVFWHGGIAFGPYRSQYEKIIRKPDMHYQETYNASEGFFGLQNDLSDPNMLLMIDYGIFYEFCAMDNLDHNGQPIDESKIVPLWEVEPGVNYAMIISTNCGLWRYLIGDTVKFSQKDPYKFCITGRTKHFINAFGEELIIDNAEKGLQFACEQTGAEVLEYTAAPVFMDNHAKCRHQWVIEFAKAPDDLSLFASLLDKKLQELNSDYEAKRYKDITLQHLEIIPARQNLFNQWMKSRGKLGGQNKVPRLSNSRRVIDELIAMNA